jgi:hypothetical protein
MPQDPLAQGEPSPETPRAAIAPYQKRCGSSIHRWIGVVLSKHQNFHCNGLPETLKTARLPHAVLKLCQLCTSKARKNFLTIFGNNRVPAAYEKIAADSIPQRGKYPAGLPAAAAQRSGRQKLLPYRNRAP